MAARGQTVDPNKVPGSWKPFPLNSLQQPYQSPAWLPLTVGRDLGMRLNEVAEVFHRTPYLVMPTGWVMFPHAQVHLDRSWAARSDPRWIVAGRLSLLGGPPPGRRRA